MSTTRTGALRALPPAEWHAMRDRHAARVEPWVRPHLERRQNRTAHPVEDFLFTYYSFRPAALQRWHPGYGTSLAGAEEYAGLKGYADLGTGVGVPREHVASQQPLISSIHALLSATAARSANFGCFGMHEWAMVYRQQPDDVRHAAWPLRLGGAGTDDVVDAHRITCSHFDAFRFFTEPARPGRRSR